MIIALWDKKKELVRLYVNSKTFTVYDKKEYIESLIEEDEIILIEKLSLMSKTQLISWLNLSGEKFNPISISDGFNMPIIFYDTSYTTIKLCDAISGFSSHYLKDLESIVDKNGDFAYVERASLMNKKQFISLIENKKLEEQSSGKKYLHTVHDGTVLIEDVEVDGKPLQINGKYDFIEIDDSLRKKLEVSANFRILLKKGKVEEIDENYVEKNKNKAKNRPSRPSTIPVGSVKDFEKEDENNEEIITIEIQ